MMYNNNDTIVYCKGPVLIHRIVEKWGEINWLSFMKRLYMQYKYYPNLTYDLFISTMAEMDQQYASELDSMLRNE